MRLKICSVDDCGKKVLARGFCRLHYWRNHRTGDPLIVRSERNGNGYGKNPSPGYRAWKAMKVRCNNPNQKEWHRYGGRGISYDPRWERYSTFLADMGEKPEGFHMHRIDPDGNYTRENCRWIKDSDHIRMHAIKRKRAKNGTWLKEE